MPVVAVALLVVVAVRHGTTRDVRQRRHASRKRSDRSAADGLHAFYDALHANLRDHNATAILFLPDFPKRGQ